MIYSRREALLAGIVAMAVTVLPVAWSVRTLDTSGRSLQDAQAAHQAVLTQAAELVRLRQQDRVVEAGPALQSDVHARAQLVLQAAGLDPRRLRSTADSAATPIKNTPYQRQVATVTIEQVSAVDVAKVLTHWRDAEPAWTVRSIRLDHAATGRRGADHPTDERFTLILTLENVHLSPSEQGASS